MARRGSNFTDFVRNFGAGLNLVNQVRQDVEIGRIADAKPEQSQGFTAADGAQLEAIANAKDADGKPYYTLGTTADGGYTVTDNANPAQTGVIAQRGVTDFLGQRTAGDLSEGQVTDARQRAMAGVMMRTDPAGAGRMLRDLKQGQQEDQRFTREQQTWKRQDDDVAKADAYEADRQAAFDNSYFGQNQRSYVQELQKWRQDAQAREASPGGPAMGMPMPQPARPVYSQAAALADQALLMAVDAKHGRLDQKAVMEFSTKMKHVEEEGYVKALQLAQQGGSLDAVAQAFNAGGAVKFDPSAVVSDKMEKNREGVPTRVIEIRDPSGKTQKINTLAELDALGKAQHLFERQFKVADDERADKQNAIRNGLAASADRRAQAEFDAGAPQRDLGGALAGLQLAVVNAKTPEEAAAARSKLAAAQSGLGANKKEAPTGYRWKENGDLEAIPGGPGAKKEEGKPMPGAAAKGLLENQQSLRRAQGALALSMGLTVNGAAGDTEATGMKGYLPNQLLNRLDPAGVDTRAAIADLGSLVIHTRSGAAVTAAEFPRLAPFIPTEKDDPATVQKKLKQFVATYETIIQEEADFYRAQGYNVPTATLRPANVTPPGGSPKPAPGPAPAPAPTPGPAPGGGQAPDFTGLWG